MGTHRADAGHMSGGAPILPSVPFEPAHHLMRRFVLARTTDISGISGVGVVAEGVQFSGGRVVLCWVVGTHQSMVIWDNIEDVVAIHGHDGHTTVEWSDQ